MENQSASSEAFLVGFPGIPEDMHSPVSTAMFLVYMVSLIANGCVISLVTLNAYLHHPMYLLIANLASSDLLFDTVTLPKLIAKYWFGSSTINLKVCLFQMFCVHYLGSLDSYLMMMMAIDRYVAISQPLRYSLIVTNKRLVIVCVITWILIAPSTNIVINIQTSENILYCPPSPKKINTLFCTQTTVTTLACTDATNPRKVAFVSALVVLLVPLGLILLSYILILLEIFTFSRYGNWQKAFYTCATHLLVVALYYVPRVFFYIVTNIPSIIIIKPDISALILFLYSTVPHMANPIIYFLRTKEIRQTMAKSIQRIKPLTSPINTKP
ncbi:hypothetical protein GDO81_016001 [Engystomops pustulosus]|uniref:Olfactory receptor n=1 Tax=Engystomops pustulosus TaxID=76066 RepID=A0AAV7ATJ4_ENGPU|nr:hypothetical protein GDO81_018550 [Engystomops pustulosus]KAG8563282.1 hypothetical protein GDO81_016001 [Engystomops pustulosus]